MRAALDPVAFVAGRKTIGGPTPAEVPRAIARARVLPREHTESVDAMRDGLRAARAQLRARVQVLLSSG